MLTTMICSLYIIYIYKYHSVSMNMYNYHMSIKNKLSLKGSKGTPWIFVGQ